ncbi:polysaccharide deacetylase family protein [Pseudomonas sp. 10B1]|uniref:polysaccharide deacetylase family protein n=1 Tax=unclassified Pseudomonas TaxID=196821 RepID=UPI002AB583F4|nr:MULTISPECIES: polysaccharide deacetylase family protein [unclassified Pseudomonas]MDY7561748.1 polysaccharide deacetylase family protein [Pseudomonas sp. AB6]MEA9996336.1 polysaccharide deacetylase family protein [Pseudomonas sp. AA4]MEB0085858.1 polysaccharide deacetylase family protein [Pseudomonas sp. RTI1]MEB0125817.1 polysaccharide deacetylase family protein [Pseudomonas sp. CCC1.2]MEB0154385.1 polysaccharide deacetylase family protein [Pseudomonas sp. CCC4.3]
MSDTHPAVLVVLHDVAPETWSDYQPFVEAIDALGSIPMTWLVVPDFHKRNPLGIDLHFQRVLESRVARGDELALHGYYHCDDSPPPKTPREYFMRRILTWEGEFYALDHDHALARLQAGVELFERLGWPLHGFVAPAWLMSDGTREALRAMHFSYTSDSQNLFQLPDFSKIAAPGMVWSARSAWRRGVSKLVSDRLEIMFQKAQVIRLGLHPVDMRHPFSRNYWLKLLQRLIDGGRTPMTKADWIATHHNAPRSIA